MNAPQNTSEVGPAMAMTVSFPPLAALLATGPPVAPLGDPVGDVDPHAASDDAMRTANEPRTKRRHTADRMKPITDLSS
jgi:hypothetical protein